MGLTWAKHAVLKPPTEAEMARMEASQLFDLHRVYHEAIQNAAHDPLRFGFQLESWAWADDALKEVDEVQLYGGHRSSKTTYGARKVVECATGCMDAHIVCFSQNEDTSIKVQQKTVYEYLPPELRKKQKSGTGYINFSLQNGFTNRSFIIPETRSRVDFKTYTQWMNNMTILEGFEFGALTENMGLNVGAWLDEYLLDGSLVNTLRSRLVTRNSKLLITFTPIDGYTPFVAEYLRGAETLKSRKAPLLNDEVVPVLQKCHSRDARIVYFHTDKNPFAGYDRLAKNLAYSTRDEILTKAYGVPVKSMANLFPMFNKEVNVIAADKFPRVTGRDYTRYMVCDPAGNKNWFLVWIAVDAVGTWWVYREWPSLDTHGEWAKPGKGGWTYAIASKGIGNDAPTYANLITEMEGDEVVFERIIDSRAGATKYSSQTQGLRTLIMDLADCGLIFVPARGNREDIGLQKMHELFHYDDKQSISGTNRPKFYISTACGNTIESLANYGARGKEDEPLKDPIDCLRYAREADIEHYTAESMRSSRKTWSY